MLRTTAIALLLAAVITGPATAQDLETIWRMLEGTPYQQFASRIAPEDLDRPLTTSDFDAGAESFVAAVHFVDELRGRHELGPVTLIRITRDGRITRRRTEPIGTVTGVQTAPWGAVIRIHRTPSAGGVIILNRDLEVVAELDGYGGDVLPNGTVMYRGNMVHFAPIHKQSVWAYEPGAKEADEIFPGAFVSRIGEQVRQAIRATVIRIGNSAKIDWNVGGSGAPDDYDRSITRQENSSGGNSVALVVKYDNDRLLYGDPNVITENGETTRRDASWPAYEALTVVRCDRAQPRRWSCRERLLADAAREFKIAVPARSEETWQAHDAALTSILKRELAKK